MQPRATAATSVSKAGPETRTSGMSSTTTGPGDDASASLPELAAAEESEPDVCLGFVLHQRKGGCTLVHTVHT